MLLEDYIPTTPKKYRNAFFSGIAFDSTKVKKDHIFLQLKVIKLMAIILYLLQLKRVVKLL